MIGPVKVGVCVDQVKAGFHRPEVGFRERLDFLRNGC